jgi:hypothetical protein
MFFDPFDDFRVTVSDVVPSSSVLAAMALRNRMGLLITITLHASTEDLALKDIEGGKQGRDAMALVVPRVIVPARPPLHRQSRGKGTALH